MGRDATDTPVPFNRALLARHGVLAAHLASFGFGGPPAIFQGKYPLGQAFTGQWHARGIVQTSASSSKVMELYFKRSCLLRIHSSRPRWAADIQKSEHIDAEASSTSPCVSQKIRIQGD